MENTDNKEIIVKKKTSEAMLAAQKRYYNIKKRKCRISRTQKGIFSETLRK